MSQLDRPSALLSWAEFIIGNFSVVEKLNYSQMVYKTFPYNL